MIDNIQHALAEDFWAHKLKEKTVVAGTGSDTVFYTTGISFRDVDITYFSKITAGKYLSEYTVALAIYALLLKRYFPYNNTTVFSVDHFERNGHYTSNSVLFDLPVERDLTLKQFLQNVKTEVQQVYNYIIYDPASLEKRLDGRRFEDVTPFGFLYTAAREYNTMKSNFQLHLDKNEDGVFTASITFAAGFTEKLVAEHFLENWRNCICNLEAHTNIPVNTIPLLSPQERNQIIYDFNDTKRIFPVDRTIKDMFEARVVADPYAVALVYENNTMSYDMLNREANRLANYILSHHTIRPDEVIGILLPKSDRALIAILAVLKMGAAWLPIDPQYPEDRIQYIIRNSSLNILIGEYPETNVTIINPDRQTISEQPDTNPGIQVAPDQLAYVIYTSGSTGHPKGVMVAHHSSVNMSVDQIRIFNITNQDKVVWFASISFDATVSEIMMALYSGATLLIPGDQVLKDRKAFADFISTNKATVVTLPPSYLDLLDNTDLAGIRCIISAGEAAHTARAVQLSERMEYYNAYGPTECAVCVSTYRVTPDDANRIAIPIGKPIANLAVYILDDDLQPVPVGVEGRLFVSGIGVAKGYLNNPELTAQKFVPDVFSIGDPMYDTGDIAKWLPDGNIGFIGRKDEQVKIRGYRIEPGEIEQAMLALPIDILQTAVAVKEMNKEKILVAYYVSSGNINKVQIREELSKVLPAHMLPSFFVRLSKLPVTPNGKVDRKVLPDVGQEDAIRRLYVSPRNSLEQQLVSIWQNILGVTDIGITDDFFDLGGNSLLINRVAATLRNDLNADVPVKELFARTTIADLAKFISERDSSMAVFSITKKERPELIPVSFSQERLWLIDQIEGSLHYHLPVVVRLQGPFEPVLLEQAFLAVINRHEVLRSGIRQKEDKVYQYITQPGWLNLQVTEEYTGSVQDFITAISQQPFDLSSGALLRACLIKQAPSAYLLVLVMHHIIADGWSMPILVKELMELYQAAKEGRPPALPELKIQYADYAIWQREYITGAVLESKLRYWEERLQDLVPLEVPTDFPRPAIRSTRGKEYTFKTAIGLTRELKDLSRQEGVTLFMLLLGVFKLLLYKYTGQQDISVGTPVANRGQKEIEPLIGFFVNTLVLRSDLGGDPSFTELLARIKQTALDAYAHQDVPFEKVVDRVEKERRLNQTPLFQVLFALQNNENITATQIGEVDFAVEHYEQQFARFDLSVNITEQASGLQIHIQYCSDLFLPQTIISLASHFEKLLAAVVVTPEKKISQLSMLSAEEERWLLNTGNRSTVNYPRDKHFTAIFDEQVQRTPDAIAIIFEGKSITFYELQQCSDQLAGYLHSVGVSQGDLVLLCLDGGLEHTITGILGILKAGAAYVPVDPDYPKERISYLLKDTKALVAVTNKACQVLKGFDTLCLVEIDTDDDWSAFHKPVLSQSPEDLMYVIYTSGSTGQPKGVLISSGNILDYVYGLFAHTGITACRSFGLMSTIATDLGNTVLFSAMLSGGTLHMFTKNNLTSAAYLHGYFRENIVDCIKIVPSLWNSLGYEDKLLLPARMIIFGGEVLTGRMMQAIRAARPELEVINHYGPTETTIGKLLYQTEPQQEYHTVPIGQPFSNSTIYIVDRDGALCPVGVSGELLIGGEGVAKGYLNRPDLTAEKFIVDYFDPHNKGRLYRTGDRVKKLPDGNIRFIGRIDDQVKIRGYRVEPAEITAILNSSGKVKQGIVVVKEERLIAYIVPDESYEKEVLLDFLRERLPTYMVPAIVMEITALPLTSNGKVDKKALPAPDFSVRTSNSYVAPGNETEQILADIWQELLHIPHIGIHDNFFELGGDSIISIQVVSRANRHGLTLQPQHIFECQTIAGLSLKLKQHSILTAGEQEILKGKAGLAPIQHRFLDIDYPGRSHYNQSQLLTIPKYISASHIATAVNTLILHHDALRFCYRYEEGNWSQEYGEQTEIFFEEQLQQTTPDKLEELISSTCRHYQQSLNIEKGILIKTVLLHMPDHDDHNRLFIVIHHLAVDGVSWRILLEQLNSLLKNLETSPGRKTNSYREWTSALTVYAQNPVVVDQLPYWQSVTAAYKALPVDIKGSDNLITTAAERHTHRVELSSILTTSLLHEIHHAYGTEINDVLLSALALTLQEQMGMSRVVIGLEGHGRQSIPGITDITGTVGWFTNIYPVLLETQENITPTDLLSSIKEQLRSIPQKGIGYGLLKYLHQADTLTGTHWDLVFNYLGQLDNVVSGDALIGPATGNTADNIGASFPFTGKLDVNSIVSNGRLQVDWNYAPAQYTPDTISSLANAFIDTLTTLITHCKACELRTYTPSDFGLAPEVGYKELSAYLSARTRDKITAIYPLSTLQQGMLFHHLYSDNGKAYKEQLRLDFPEGLDIVAFRQTWDYLLQQHTILRSSIVTNVFSIPVQCVHEMVTLPFEIIDYSEYGPEEQNARFAGFLETDMQRPFNISEAPLMRLTLVKMGNTTYKMVWTHHHMISDGWSNAVLVAEFLQAYNAFANGKLPAVSPVDHYADYLRYVNSLDKQEAAGFWKSYMDGFTGNTFLPFTGNIPDQTRNKTDANIQHRHLRINADMIGHARLYCQQQQITMNTLVQGVWALLLNRYTGNMDVNFGVVVSGRPADLPGAEHKVGLYINNLPLRCQIDEGANMNDWLKQVQKEHNNARTYQYTGLSEIKRLIGSRGDLFDSILVFENYPDLLDESTAQLLKIDNIAVAEQTNYLLTIIAVDRAEALHFDFSYNSDLLEPWYVDLISAHFERTLTQIVTVPGIKLKDIDILSLAEKNLLTWEFNNTGRNYPRHKTIIDLFEQQVINTPEKIAVLFEENSLTYHRLDEKANALAHYLQKQGIKTGDLIAVCMERSLDMMITLLGIQKAGGAYVPVDPEYPVDRIRYILEDTAAKIIMTDRYSLQKLASLENQHCIKIDAGDHIIELESTQQPYRILTETDPAYVIYTSGSTGKPKGVINEHAGVVNRLLWAQEYFQLNGEDVILQKTTFSFDVSVWELFWPLIAGAGIVFARPGGHRDNTYLKNVIEKNHVTTVHFVPSMLGVFLPDVRKGDCSSLKRVLCSGEALKRNHISMFHEKLPDIPLFNLYGPTEAAVDVTCWEVPAKADNVLIGKPVANTALYILNPQGQLQPVGVTGELYIGGIQVARGYLNRPELSAERFITNAAGTRLYKTGDLAKWLPDGNIEYQGRIDQQVKLRGYRIELDEIIAVLNGYPGIATATVVLKEDVQENKRLVAYIVPVDTFDRQAVVDYLKSLLPEYMVPSVFMTLPALPLTSNGKIDNAALPEPDNDGLHTKDYVAPRNETESLLANIWQELLHVGKVGIYDNFFELGGDSIISIQVVSRVAKEQLTLRPQDIFEYQTIAGLAHRLSDNRPIASQEIPEGEALLLPIQQWFLETPYSVPAHFNQSHLLKIDKHIIAEHLSIAVKAIVAHHDALRFRYLLQADGSWKQEYGAVAGKLHIEDLRSEAATTITEICNKYQKSIDLAAGELIRLVLIQMPGHFNHNRLLIVVHHLAVDGVSWRILFDHLQTCLSALQQEIPLPVWTKGSSYSDWGKALKEHAMRSDVVSRQSYWKAVGAAYTPLPADSPDQQGTSASRITHNTRLDKDETRSLLQEVNQAYNTEINDVLLAALAHTLYSFTGRLQTVVAVEGHGRGDLNGTDVSNLVGWCTSLYPVALKATANDSLADLLCETKEQLRQIPGKRLEYGLLRYLHPDADIRKAMADVRWDILFNYLGQVDNILHDNALLLPADENTGESVDAAYPLPAKLSISCLVKDGQLQVNWSYAAQQFHKTTIEKIADDFNSCLLNLIAHTRQQTNKIYTPFDFGLAPEVGFQELQTYLAANSSVTEVYRLSPLQRAMLFHYLYEGSESYKEQIQFDLPDGIDIPAFKTAWDVLFKKHTVLRSSFLVDTFKVPVQCVHENISWPFILLDFSALPAEERQSGLTAFLNEDFKQGFNLEVPPLMRITLIKLSDVAYKMVWTYYHIILDGWSNAVLMTEFLTAYEACLKGQALSEDREDKYSDYLRYMARTNQYEAERHWKNYLQGVTGKTLLPFVTNVSEQMRNKGEGETAHQFLLIPGTRTNLIKQYCQQQQITVNTFVQGIWALLLSRYTGRNDIMYGVVVSGRPAELERSEQRVGLYINNLPLHTVLPHDQPVADWLKKIQKEQTDIRQFQYTTITEIQEWLQQKGELFDSVVVFDNYPKAVYDEGQHPLKVGNMHIEERRNYLLSLSVSMTDVLDIDFAYNKVLLPAEHVIRMKGHFDTVITQLIANAGIRLKDVSMLTSIEEQQLLEDFNNTKTYFPDDKTIVDIFEAQVIATPHHPALVFKDETITYKELDERANRLAWFLRDTYGLKADDLVGIMMDRSPWAVIAVLGILKAGAAYVPVDINYPEDRKSFIIRDTGMKALLMESVSMFGNLSFDLPMVFVDIQYDDFNMPEDYRRDYTISPGDLAYVIYTSGSTGIPKGVMIEHTSNVNMSIDQIRKFGITEKDRVLQFAAMSFDAAVSELFMAFYCGAALVLVEESVIADSNRFITYIRDRKVTVATFPPVYLRTLDRGSMDFMRVIITAGESAVTADALHYAGIGDYFNAYGPTECAVCVSVYKVHPGDASGRQIPVGRPLSNMRVYITDDHLNLLPLGVEGNLYVSGTGLARGYLNRPDLTAEKFVADPFSSSPAERLYKTGDIAYWLPDGNLVFAGRIDDQVKIRGYRIELDEVALALNECDSVNQAAVIAREDGAGNKRLIAYIVPKDSFDKEEIMEWMKNKLPDYMVPALIIPLTEFPLTTSGKIDRKNLPDPDVSTLAKNEFVAPRNEIEQQLSDIWKQLLHVGNIGIHDNFFDLGGDSIISIQVVSRINRLGWHIHPQDIFEYQTIQALAAKIERTQNISSAEQDILSGVARLLPIQQWFLETPYDEKSHYNQSQLLSIDKSITAVQIETALNALLVHHDALRFTYNLEDGNWIQEYDKGDAIFETVELTEEINTVCNAAQHSLRISGGPLMKVILMHTSDAEKYNRLFLVIHHLVIDGVSWRILLEHLRILIEDGNATPGIKTSSFRQWADTLYNYAQDIAVTSQLPFWQQVTASYSPIQIDKPENADKQATAGERSVHTVTLDSTLTRYLLTEANNAYNTEINDMLLSALVLTLHRVFGLEKWVIGMENHGREYLSHNIDLSNTVGWFTNLYPVLLTIDTDSSIADLLRTVKEQLRTIPQKGLGYGLLRYMNAKDELAGAAWDVLFNYLGQTDNILEDHPFLHPATERPGDNIGSSWPYNTRLDINCMVVGGELTLNWSYSQLHFFPITIEKLASDFVSNLTGIITHCCNNGERQFTPSDYGLAPEVGYRELSRFFAVKGRQSITDIYRLSPLQKGMLFHHLYDTDGNAYVEQLQVELPGELNVPAFKAAWENMLAHHTILRSSFIADELMVPVQCVHDKVELPFEVLDYTGLAADQKQTALYDFLEADRRRGFDFKVPPLMRITLIRTSPEHYTMVWTHYHIILDGWSNAALIATFLKVYAAYAVGAAPLPREEDRYADYIRYIGKMNIHEAEQFWKSYMSGFHEKTLLPFVGNISEIDRNKGDGKVDHLSLDIADDLAKEIRHYCQQGQITVNTLIQGVWAILLSHYTGREQVCFGAVVSGRPSDMDNAEQRIGLYINNLPLHIVLEAQQEITGWLRNIQKEHTEARRYQYTALNEIQSWIGIKGDLFDSIIIFENYPKITLTEEEKLLNTGKLVLKEQNNYLFTIMVQEQDGTLKFDFSFNSTLLNSFYAAMIRDHFEQVLMQLIHKPTATIADISLLTPNERDRLLYGFNDTLTDYPADSTVVSQFAAQVHRTPYNTAIVFEEESLTYQELDERTNQLAHFLISKGIGKGDLVAICIERSAEIMVALLGILKTGAAYIPIDPVYPVDRISYMLLDADIRCVLVKENTKTIVPPEYKDGIVCLDDQEIMRSLEEQDKSIPAISLPQETLAYVIYTSGSTGRPKGVMITHGNLINFFEGLDQRFTTTDRQETWLAVTSISFDISGLELFWTITRGNKVILLPDRPGQVKEAAEMDFSLFYFAAREAVTTENKFRLLLEGAKFADNNGLSAVWIPERHFHNFGDQFPNPSVAAAAVAAITRNIRIRSGSVVLPLHDPIRVAEEWSMVDNISEGRVEMSVASGWHPNDFVFAPADHLNRHQRMREKLNVVCGLWEGNPHTRINGEGKEIDIQLHPKPVQKTLPVWVTAAGSDETFRYAGSIGANVLTHLLGKTKEELKEKIAVYRKSLEEHGFDPEKGKVALMLHTFIGNDLKQVEAVVKEPFKKYLSQSLDLLRPVVDQAGLDLEKDLDTILEIGFHRYFSTSGLFGTPESCMAGIRDLSAIGVNEIACLIDFGIDTDTTLAHLPQLKKLQELIKQTTAQQQLMTARLGKEWSPAELIRRHQVTHMQCTPSFAQELLVTGEGQQALQQLQTLLIGGEVLPAPLVKDLFRYYKKPLYNMYGPTETTIWSAIKTVVSHEDITIGTPIANTKLYVLNQRKELMPLGVAGELYIGGDGVAKGYLNRKELSAERFIDNPFIPGEKIYRTGDLAKWRQNGEMECLGRIDDQVKINGHRIETGEIETVMHEWPGIAQCVVAPKEDPDGNKQLVGYIVTAGVSINKEALRDYLKAKLPAYMVPAFLMMLEQLPLTPNGKVDRRALPGISGEYSVGHHVAPRNPVEEQLTEIWTSLLKKEKISISDSFFDLGGNSLRGIQTIAAISNEMKMSVSIKDLFENPTIEKLALLLAERGRTEKDRLVHAPVTTYYPLTEIQKVFWLASQHAEISKTYNTTIAWQLTGSLDPDRLQTAFKTLIVRHDILGAIIGYDKQGEPVFIPGTADAGFRFIDRSNNPASLRDVLDLYEQERGISFDFAKEALLRFTLIRNNDTEYFILFNTHHVISDPVSLQVVFKELMELYEDITTLPAPLFTFKDYAWSLLQQDKEEDRRNTALFWKNYLSGRTALVKLPGLIQTASDNHKAKVVSLRIDEPQTLESLRMYNRLHQSTMFVMLMSLVKTLLYLETGQDDISFGCPINTRDRQELTDMIGLFLNTIIIRTVITPDPDFTDVYRNVKTSSVNALAHSKFPFLKLAALENENGNGERRGFNVGFNLNPTQLMENIHSAGLEFKALQVEEHVVKADWWFDIAEHDSAVSINISYRKDNFDEKYMIGLVEKLGYLIKYVIASPHEKLNVIKELITADMEKDREEKIRMLKSQNLKKLKKQLD
ncbi:non-ribosomal peptide synthase domain TIGR01720/amino acid adenylation domain-containing protein/natural product biosynthesis luciferase-like monooxygenase domain-containing protein [Chitinophaga sp. YR573]|uniref:non-ribosomal peptide synthetase n=1 Tax=Chitinophaga sp. YR573 TaxID=1881040 RepID=UPI0008C43353|nr:non-ribosomal peptide synthetase [Chitinophaga sp. YR573]SEV87472.1 non-ribosomal peptide synthase domain TIGR01720/amino acid adenylation domain-containing protein/natural product biosynthesis luciferase-like monooxygenase domain-containing protein [Chitinophaga sp. YR573]